MNREGAISGMIVGVLFTAVYIIGCRSDKILGTTEPLMSPWLTGSSWIPDGLQPEAAGAVGLILNFVVALIVSRLTSSPPDDVQDLVESVRIPRGSHAPEAHFDETDAEADNP